MNWQQLEDNYKYGSTIVINFDKRWFFIGDISHCGKKAIFHNALQIIKECIKRNVKYVYKDYNGFPIFSTLGKYKHHRLRNKKYTGLDAMIEEAKDCKHTIWEVKGDKISPFINFTEDKKPEKQIYCLEEGD